MTSTATAPPAERPPTVDDRQRVAPPVPLLRRPTTVADTAPPARARDPRLERIVNVWRTLPESVQEAVASMVAASVAGGDRCQVIPRPGVEPAGPLT